jgi:hypothetical protein
MDLYRFEVTTSEDVIYVVIAAQNEEQAFQLVEVELERYFIKVPEIQEVTLYEKKKIGKGTGFVICEQENDIRPK